MKELVHKLVLMRVRPYYIYQCDLSMGLGISEHSFQELRSLKGFVDTSGYAFPPRCGCSGGKYLSCPLRDQPGPAGSRNYEGVITTYTEPEDYKNNCHCDDCKDKVSLEGVSGILHGQQLSLEPTYLQRKERFHTK